MTPNECVGETIRDFREARGLSQIQLAQKLGAGWVQPKISLIEAGTQRVDANEVEQIAQALGMLGEEVMIEAFKRYRRSISK